MEQPPTMLIGDPFDQREDPSEDLDFRPVGPRPPWEDEDDRLEQPDASLPKLWHGRPEHEGQTVEEHLAELAAGTADVDRVRFWGTDRLSGKIQDRLRHIEAFFTPGMMERIIVPLVRREAELSLRVNDWAVMNYSNTYAMSFVNRRNAHCTSIYDEYLSMLEHWKRPMFDTFRRGTRTYFSLDGVRIHSTTVGQLGYFWWAIRIGVLRLVFKLSPEVDADMKATTRKVKRKQREREKKGEQRKRNKLADNPGLACCVTNLPINLDFSALFG